MSGSSRSVTARDITGSSILTGDHNTVSTAMKPLPVADQVDVKAELAELREALAGLKKVPDRGKLDRAMEDAVEETAKHDPDKEEVGGALERAVKYAKAAEDFGEHAEKLLPRLAALASWLGANGHGLLAMRHLPMTSPALLEPIPGYFPVTRNKFPVLRDKFPILRSSNFNTNS